MTPSATVHSQAAFREALENQDYTRAAAELEQYAAALQAAAPQDIAAAIGFTQWALSTVRTAKAELALLQAAADVYEPAGPIHHWRLDA